MESGQLIEDTEAAMDVVKKKSTALSKISNRTNSLIFCSGVSRWGVGRTYHACRSIPARNAALVFSFGMSHTP